MRLNISQLMLPVLALNSLGSANKQEVADRTLPKQMNSTRKSEFSKIDNIISIKDPNRSVNASMQYAEPLASTSFSSDFGWLSETVDMKYLRVIGDIVSEPSDQALEDIKKFNLEGFVYRTDSQSSLLDEKSFDNLASFWDDLGPDRYMKDGGAYRERSYATLNWKSDENTLYEMPYMPLYKASSYNSFAGGIRRFLQPVDKNLFENKNFKNAISHALTVFNEGSDSSGEEIKWFIEVDQYRIISHDGNLGNPTPEGVHSDGTNYFMLFMVGKTNLNGGETSLYKSTGELATKLTLENPGDYILLNDQTMLHGVTPVQARDSNGGTRDILHISFTKANDESSIERRFGKSLP